MVHLLSGLKLTFVSLRCELIDRRDTIMGKISMIRHSIQACESINNLLLHSAVSFSNSPGQGPRWSPAEKLGGTNLLAPWLETYCCWALNPGALGTTKVPLLSCSIAASISLSDFVSPDFDIMSIIAAGKAVTCETESASAPTTGIEYLIMKFEGGRNIFRKWKVVVNDFVLDMR